jgi:hypothetical protein
MKEIEESIEKKRGIENIDLTDNQLIVRENIEKVSKAFCKVRQAIDWKIDVYESEVQLSDLCFIVYQFKKHSWTHIRIENCELSQKYLNREDAKLLSSILNTKAIYYSVCDNPINLNYHLYINGNSTEEFNFCHSVDEIDERLEQEDDESLQNLFEFQSKLRQIQVGDIYDEFIFVDTFFQEQDAYMPSFSSACESGKSGRKVTLKIAGFQPEDFERMDYIVVK